MKRRSFAGIGWVLLILLVVWFAFAETSQYLHVHPSSYRQYWKVRYWLIGHIAGAAVTLLMGPIGLLAPLRRRYPHVHRWIGRMYVAAVALGAICALYLASHSTGGWMVGVLLGPLSLVWMTSTTLAFIAVRHRQIEAHREWMIRSYVVTFSFVVVRILLETPLLAGVPFPARLATLGWLSWTIPLFTTEVVLQWKRVWGRARISVPGANSNAVERASRPDTDRQRRFLEPGLGSGDYF